MGMGGLNTGKAIMNDLELMRDTLDEMKEEILRLLTLHLEITHYLTEQLKHSTGKGGDEELTPEGVAQTIATIKSCA